MNVGTDESFFKLKFSHNSEKCGWLKQMWAADEKHVSNKTDGGLTMISSYRSNF